MSRTGHSSDPRNMGFSMPQAWLSPRRIGFGVLAIISILTSPAVVVYQLLLGLTLVAAGYVARRARPDPLAGTTVRAVGIALLAGPVAYIFAWVLAELFNW